MATTLRDFIIQREGEIRDQLKALRSELKELQVAKSALDAAGPPVSASSAAPTIKDLARYVLADAPEGMTAWEILGAIKERHGREIDRTSLSPQLSRLKADNEVALLGERWFSKPHFDAKQRMVDDYFDELANTQWEEDQTPVEEETDDPPHGGSPW